MIYIGSQYFRAPTPSPECWEKDVKQAKAYGLDYLRIWLMWNWYSIDANTYDFSSLLTLLDIFHKYDVKAILLVNLESAPAWLIDKYPQAMYIDSRGVPYVPESIGNTPGGGFPGLCFHNDSVADYAKDYIARVVCAAKDHPAVDLWEPHNEPLYECSRYNNNVYCYCVESLRKFREFLERKYKNTDALNAHWRRKYNSFQQVHPPHIRGLYNDWFDWCDFRLCSLLDTIQWRIDTIRQNDSRHGVMIHSRGGTGITHNIVLEGIDDYAMSRMVEKYGTAAFPQRGPQHEYFLAMAAARSSDPSKEFWMAELQSGPYGMGIHRNASEFGCEFCGSTTLANANLKTAVDTGTVTPERLKMWSWSGIALGGKGVVYWQYRNESFGLEYGFGLTELDGSPSPRLDEVKTFKNIINDNFDLLDGAQVAASEIAIAWTPESDIVNYVAVGCTDAVKNSIKGIHKALWSLDYQIDTVRLDKDNIERLCQYKIIYLPYSPYVRTELAEKLKAFVAAGGTLIAEGSAAQFDDAFGVTAEVPGNGLAELFGCTRLYIRTTHRRDLCRFRIGDFDMTGCMHCEQLKPLPGAVVIGVFEDGSAAAVKNNFGKGAAVYLGTNPFMGFAVEPDDGLLKWLLSFNAGVKRQCWTNIPEVSARLLENNGRRIVFLLSSLGDPTSVVLKIADVDRSKMIREMIDGQSVKASFDGDVVTIHESLGAYGTKAYVIEVTE